ncbi:hypothetical protein F5Y10DRAFT_293813 [Nemania abortiva]|nr:hypothetical protein F5Y10DRAFT_293813 [Nemania abortiva]
MRIVDWNHAYDAKSSYSIASYKYLIRSNALLSCTNVQIMAEPSQNDGSETDVAPPWGAFPAENYLIRHWNFSSLLSAPDQRHRLISAFLKLDAFPKDWDATGRVYNSSTISRIPTRRERDRYDEEIWLRTHYGEGSDRVFAEMRATCEDNDPAFEEDCRTWTVLDDQALFDGDWSAALHILPELAGPTSGYDAYSHRHLGDPVELGTLRGKLRESVASALRLEGQGNDAKKLKTDDTEAGPVGMRLQASVVASFLFIADAEAFETGKLRLLFLDARGNIVREWRVPYTDTWEMRDGWNARKFLDSNFWMDRDRSEWHVPNDPGSVLGEKYGYSGEIGQELYQIPVD